MRGREADGTRCLPLAMLGAPAATNEAAGAPLAVPCVVAAVAAPSRTSDLLLGDLLLGDLLLAWGVRAWPRCPVSRLSEWAHGCGRAAGLFRNRLETATQAATTALVKSLRPKKISHLCLGGFYSAALSDQVQ